MPEHVHLLVSEPHTAPKAKPLSTTMGALKLPVSKLSQPRPFWQVRYHDFNVITQPKRVERSATSTATW